MVADRRGRRARVCRLPRVALRGLIAVQLVALVALSAVTVWRFPVWALVDERAHYDYVQTVSGGAAPAGPLLRPDLARGRGDRRGRVSPRRRARTPRTAGSRAVRTRRSSRRSTTSWPQPRSPPAATTWAKVRVLRLLGVACLLVSALLLWRLARGSPAVFAVALSFLLWPGVVVRTVTVSNAALELPLALGGAARRCARRTSAATVGCSRSRERCRARAADPARARGARPLLAVVALLHVRRGGRRAPPRSRSHCRRCCWRRGSLQRQRYGAPTASALVREIQAPVLNPSGRELGAPATCRTLHERLLGGVIAEEWWFELPLPGKRRVRDLFWLLAVASPAGAW